MSGEEEGTRGTEGDRVRGAETKHGAETGGFCGGGATGRGRGWTEGSVSALRLPDAPNIMFNDINFLLNGPRFDSRCERGAPSGPQAVEAGKKYTRENNLASGEERNRKRAEDEKEWDRKGEGGGRKTKSEIKEIYIQ